MAPKLTLASRPSCRSRMNLSLDFDGRTNSTDLVASLRDRNQGFVTGRNSYESSPQEHDAPVWEGHAAITLVGSIGRGIGCRKRVCAGFHLLRHDACSLPRQGYFRAFPVNRAMLELRVAIFGLQLVVGGGYADPFGAASHD